MSYPQLLPWTVQEMPFSLFSKLNNLYLVWDVVRSLLYASPEGTGPSVVTRLAPGSSGYGASPDLGRWPGAEVSAVRIG